MKVAVADTGPLIHLAAIDALPVLSIVDELVIPQAVYDELAVGTVPPALDDLAYEVVAGASTEVDENLDHGETAALAIAADRDAVLLTDDLAARDAAKEMGIRVHGSVGILVFAYAQGVLTKADASEQMRALQAETSLFITDAVIERGIALLEVSYNTITPGSRASVFYVARECCLRQPGSACSHED